MSSAASRTESPLVRALAVAALALAIAGCATVPGRPTVVPPVDLEAERAALRALTRWHVEGRLAVTAGNDGWSGTFTWTQADDDLDFRFRGPLGIGGFRMQGDGSSLHVETTNGEVFDLASPEEDLWARYGWSVPVTSMRHWMLGVPGEDAPAEERFAEDGRLAALEQRGWVVRYDGWSETAGLTLPRKLTMESEGVRVRVIAERWDLGR
jgi:outer membrane lipoprotein LolB